MMSFQEILANIKYYHKYGDTEVAHQECDRILKETALHTGLSKMQRKEIVQYWDKCEKWYA